MAKRGPKGVSPAEKRARKTEQPCRKVETLYANHAARPDPESIEAPKWLNAAARKIWQEKTERYRKRGQKIDGFQDALAQYCSLEADLISSYKKKIPIPIALINAHRIWCAEFFDTPASQKVPANGGAGKQNKFTSNGNRSQS